MENNEYKRDLNSGFGSPGETTRVMTKEFLRLRISQGKMGAFRSILKTRADIYSNLGYDIIDDSYIERVLFKANGTFPFIIFSDVLATNNNSLINKIEELITNLDIVLEVITENYNEIVQPNDQVKNISGFKLNVQEFINDELGKKVFMIDKIEIDEKTWENAKISELKDSNKWRKDNFGAWIYKDHFNQSTEFGWQIVTNPIYGTHMASHWQNTENDYKNENLKCKIVSKGFNNIEYNSGCYIATACYGNSNAIEVVKLRGYRDNKLSKSLFGRVFIKIYYFLSPSIAKKLQNKRRLNSFIRKQLLNKIVNRIQ